VSEPAAPRPIAEHLEQLEELIETARRRGRRAFRTKVNRLLESRWQIVQVSIAVGISWWLASDVFDHQQAVFAPIVTMISLGMSYHQRLRRVVEITVGVAVGVLVADLFITVAGVGVWQIVIVVAASLSIARFLGAGMLLVNQAAVQSIFVVAFASTGSQSFTRWLDAVIGGAVAVVAAAIVPSAPLLRPRYLAAEVARTMSKVLRGTADAARTGDIDAAVALLAEARNSDALMRRLADASAEGLDAARSSPLLRHRRAPVARVAQLIEPLDLSVRNLRVLARRIAVTTTYDEQLPESYLAAMTSLADAIQVLADVLADGANLATARPALLAAAELTGELERTPSLSTEVLLAQMRSLVVDLLRVTGYTLDDAHAALPPIRQER